MGGPLDTLEYLTRSDHRLGVLNAVRESPRTREDLRDIVDASRVTVGRIIADLEDRGWIARDGRAYEATPEGRYVAGEVTRVVENLRSFESLPPVREWCPGDEPDFELSRLSDAAVVTAHEGDLMAPIRRSLELIGSAAEVEAVANGAAEEYVDAIRAAAEGGARHRLVLPVEAVEAMAADPDRGAGMRAALETGRVDLAELDRDLPVVLLADGTVTICSGDHRTMVETDDPEVRDWAREYLASLREAAAPVGPDRFAADPPTTG